MVWYFIPIPIRVIKNWNARRRLHSNGVTLDIGRKRGSQSYPFYFNISWIDGHSTKRQKKKKKERERKANIPSRQLCCREVPDDSIRGRDSSSPRSLFLLISRWQNTSMTGWLWATRTLRNPRYATKAARDKSWFCVPSISCPTRSGLMLNATALTTATATTTPQLQQIDVSFLSVCPLTDDKLCHNIVKLAVEITSRRWELRQLLQISLIS